MTVIIGLNVERKHLGKLLRSGKNGRYEELELRYSAPDLERPSHVI
jgi:hypothetical protein